MTTELERRAREWAKSYASGAWVTCSEGEIYAAGMRAMREWIAETWREEAKFILHDHSIQDLNIRLRGRVLSDIVDCLDTYGDQPASVPPTAESATQQDLRIAGETFGEQLKKYNESLPGPIPIKLNYPSRGELPEIGKQFIYRISYKNRGIIQTSACVDNPSDKPTAFDRVNWWLYESDLIKFLEEQARLSALGELQVESEKLGLYDTHKRPTREEIRNKAEKLVEKYDMHPAIAYETLFEKMALWALSCNQGVGEE